MELFLVMGGKDGKPKLFWDIKGLSHFLNNIIFYKIIACTRFWGPIGCPVGVTINTFKGGVF